MMEIIDPTLQDGDAILTLPVKKFHELPQDIKIGIREKMQDFAFDLAKYISQEKEIRSL